MNANNPRPPEPSSSPAGSSAPPALSRAAASSMPASMLGSWLQTLQQPSVSQSAPSVFIAPEAGEQAPMTPPSYDGALLRSRIFEQFASGGLSEQAPLAQPPAPEAAAQVADGADAAALDETSSGDDLAAADEIDGDDADSSEIDDGSGEPQHAQHSYSEIGGNRGAAGGSADGMAGHAGQTADDIAALIERYVSQVLVEDSSGLGERKIALQLNTAVLPNTELVLSQAGGNWMLRANTKSSNIGEKLQSAEARLRERFAERGLGAISLEVDVQTETANEQAVY